MANTILHKADTRGGADHGWLKARHTFSFAGYHDESRIHFGALRVLNDDIVAPGMGFGTHPHDNMEIITIPLSGTVEHKDSMGNTGLIRKGDIQVMSAGTGVQHSEKNPSQEEALKLLQIWVFPRQRNLAPRYDQLTLNTADSHNNLQQILSPDADDAGVWIHQDAWFHLGNLDAGFQTEYKLKKQGNGVYIFLISGEVIIDGQKLESRDGLGIKDAAAFQIEALKDSELLLMEVPM